MSPAGVTVARSRHAYPQVDPGASGLVDAPVAAAPPAATAAEALRIVQASGAVAATLGEGARMAAVLQDDLARAIDLGLGDLPAVVLTRSLPLVEGRESEVAVRRRLAAGAPLALVRDGSRIVGAVRGGTGPVSGAAPGSGVAAMMGRRLAGRLPDASFAVLRLVAEAARACRARAYLAGGLVRDAWLRTRPGPQAVDIDVAVEGDALRLAMALAGSLGGELVEHARFLTASVRVPGGGRVDVATARAERYEAPGALPRVVPASIRQDLGRRDFTVNAMAVELDSGSFGLLDPHGGRSDLDRRRLRVLHPLSFVEDPTRIFRAARYAARLGLSLDRPSARAQALALRLAPYPALSGPRIVAEIDRILADSRPDLALGRLGAAGAFRLLDPGHRFTRVAAALVARLPAAIAWSRGRGLAVRPAELALLALLGDQPRDLATRALRRLGLAGEPMTRLQRAIETVVSLPARLTAASTPSARAGLLRAVGALDLAGLWLAGDDPCRLVVEWYVDGPAGVRSRLRGDDLVALGVPPGPQVGRLLQELRDGRLDGCLLDEAAEREHVRRRLAGPGSPAGAGTCPGESRA
jgi:tRNA nucleotidyltransferase (CCA-adding enzyme)